MYSPKVTGHDSSIEIMDVFGGYNKNLLANGNEFCNMKNMTGDFYPLAATRTKRAYVKQITDPQGIICKDSLCYVENGEFYINGVAVAGLQLSVLPENCPKTLISMGAYVVIFPDKVYVNTENPSDIGGLEASFTLGTSAQVTYTPCKKDGAQITPTVSNTPPASPNNGAYWIDTSSDPHTLKVWSTAQDMWVSVATSFVKIEAGGIGVSFSADDSINISGCSIPGFDGYHRIEDKTNNCLIIDGVIDTVTTQTGGLAIDRSVPDMDYIVECNNRIWGCRYGPTANGTVNEIYACKLGDFKNWRYYQGISNDSYCVSLGSDGIFTGATAYEDSVVFFKENYIHHIYGNMPSAYNLFSVCCNGVQYGSSASVQVVEGVVLYKGDNGFYQYNGKLPNKISYAFGDEKFSNAVAGVFDHKYYVSMQDSDGTSHLFVYDMHSGIWHREDNTSIKFICRCRNDLYYVDADDKLWTVHGTVGTPEGDFDWMLETAEAGYSYQKSYIEKLFIRMLPDRSSYVHVSIQYDGGEWERVCTIGGHDMINDRTVLTPQRCDRYKLKIEGHGDCKIFSITKQYRKGSDI